jgi:glycosyltransferase involved in cell wall biosynthesis
VNTVVASLHRENRDTHISDFKSESEPVYALTAPRISIIVTNHNYARYVEQAIRSVAAQTYEDWECIIVDDASTDNSMTVIEKCLGEMSDGRFSVLRMDKNSGQLAAMKAAVSRISSGFVAFLDADDVWLPGFLEQHVRAHLNRTFSAGVTASDTYFIDEFGRPLAGTAPNITKERGESTTRGVSRASGEPLVYERGVISVATPSEPTLTHISHKVFGWHAVATSAMVFRSTLLPLVLPKDNEAFRICADYPMYLLSHLISGTIVIDANLSLYRVHGKNGYSHFPWVGGGGRLADHYAANARHAPHMLQHLELISPELERLCGARRVQTMTEHFKQGNRRDAGLVRRLKTTIRKGWLRLSGRSGLPRDADARHLLV